MSACRSCGASIMWCATPSGKSMPVDAEPSDRGNMVVENGRVTAVVASDAVEEMRSHGYKLHTSHFATCSNAKQHRRSR